MLATRDTCIGSEICEELWTPHRSARPPCHRAPSSHGRPGVLGSADVLESQPWAWRRRGAGRAGRWHSGPLPVPRFCPQPTHRHGPGRRGDFHQRLQQPPRATQSPRQGGPGDHGHHQGRRRAGTPEHACSLGRALRLAHAESPAPSAGRGPDMSPSGAAGPGRCSASTPRSPGLLSPGLRSALRGRLGWSLPSRTRHRAAKRPQGSHNHRAVSRDQGRGHPGCATCRWHRGGARGPPTRLPPWSVTQRGPCCSVTRRTGLHPPRWVWMSAPAQGVCFSAPPLPPIGWRCQPASWAVGRGTQTCASCLGPQKATCGVTAGRCASCARALLR